MFRHGMYVTVCTCILLYVNPILLVGIRQIRASGRPGPGRANLKLGRGVWARAAAAHGQSESPVVRAHRRAWHPPASQTRSCLPHIMRHFQLASLSAKSRYPGPRAGPDSHVWQPLRPAVLVTVNGLGGLAS